VLESIATDNAAAKGGIMGEETERNRVLRALNDMLAKGARLHAEIEALSPQERKIFENEEQENHSEVQFLHEIVRRVLEGSMSATDAEQWSGEMDQEIEKRFRRQMSDASVPSADVERAIQEVRERLGK
jgi:hypothetical protein